MSFLAGISSAEIEKEVAVALIVLAIMSGYRLLLKGLSRVNTNLSRWWMRREISRLEGLHEKPQALQELFIRQITWMLSLLGVLLMFSVIDTDPAGATLWNCLRFVIGTAIYTMGVYALGTAHQLNNFERSMTKLRRELKALESKS